LLFESGLLEATKYLYRRLATADRRAGLQM